MRRNRLYLRMVFTAGAAAMLALSIPRDSNAAAARDRDEPSALNEQARQACVTVRSAIVQRRGGMMATATGSGFFVGPDLVLTCNHVTQIPMGPRRMIPANQIELDMDGGETAPATVVARDTAHDLALLRLEEGSRFEGEPLTLSAAALKPGLGYSVVGDFPDAIRVTRGKLISPSVMRGFAMGDAKVRSGFSGGPVLDADGKVLGILSQRDMQNNSIFVRPEVIASMLKQGGIESAPRDFMAPPTDRAVANARGTSEARRAAANDQSNEDRDSGSESARPMARASKPESIVLSVNRAGATAAGERSMSPKPTKEVAKAVASSRPAAKQAEIQDERPIAIPTAKIDRMESAGDVSPEPVIVALPVRPAADFQSR